jgi:hypothetical protein
MADTSIRPDETKAEIFSEHTWIQGAFLGSVAYGMATILFMVSVRLLWIARKGGNKTRNLGLMVYIIIIFILSTLYTAGLLEFTQESFIDGRNIEGGPNAYESVMYSIPIDMLANVTLVILAWMCDIINVRVSSSYLDPLEPVSPIGLEMLRHIPWRKNSLLRCTGHSGSDVFVYNG